MHRKSFTMVRGLELSSFNCNFYYNQFFYFFCQSMEENISASPVTKVKKKTKEGEKFVWHWGFDLPTASQVTYDRQATSTTAKMWQSEEMANGIYSILVLSSENGSCMIHLQKTCRPDGTKWLRNKRWCILLQHNPGNRTVSRLNMPVIASQITHFLLIFTSLFHTLRH